MFASYYEVNGQTACEQCCFKLREPEAEGGGLARAFRAMGAGAAAALGGCILYWGILALSGYEFALIAIVVGVAVGKGVHWGSRGRGGWRYQLLAMTLTYLAIVGAYVPLIVSEVRKELSAQAELAQADDAAAETVTATAASDTPDEGMIALIGLGTLLGLVIASPFLAGFENAIGLVIIGVGLYEAWKINRRQPIVITGPHMLATAGAAVAAPAP